MRQAGPCSCRSRRRAAEPGPAAGQRRERPGLRCPQTHPAALSLPARTAHRLPTALPSPATAAFAVSIPLWRLIPGAAVRAERCSHLPSSWRDGTGSAGSLTSCSAGSSSSDRAALLRHPLARGRGSSMCTVVTSLPKGPLSRFPCRYEMKHRRLTKQAERPSLADHRT